MLLRKKSTRRSKLWLIVLSLCEKARIKSKKLIVIGRKSRKREKNLCICWKNVLKQSSLSKTLFPLSVRRLFFSHRKVEKRKRSGAKRYSENASEKESRKMPYLPQCPSFSLGLDNFLKEQSVELSRKPQNIDLISWHLSRRRVRTEY